MRNSEIINPNQNSTMFYLSLSIVTHDIKNIFTHNMMHKLILMTNSNNFNKKIIYLIMSQLMKCSIKLFP